ncbi:MAG: hypothetical protein EBX40_02690 [Gammaproteobacteria bacterium]|nr:hypothetical protein [Gammaproteobacteria bacterium]
MIKNSTCLTASLSTLLVLTAFSGHASYAYTAGSGSSAHQGSSGSYKACNNMPGRTAYLNATQGHTSLPPCKSAEKTPPQDVHYANPKMIQDSDTQSDAPY